MIERALVSVFSEHRQMIFITNYDTKTVSTQNIYTHTHTYTHTHIQIHTHIKFRGRGITQKKACNIQNTANV